MNRKQKRLARQRARARNRKRYLFNRIRWCRTGGPLAVMEEPTEEHVKALLMKWLSKLPDLGNKKVFADPPNEFLVGHKGEQFLTTGYVLAEYFEKLRERRIFPSLA